MTAWLPIFALIATLIVGCSPTKQARSMETSGFLGDLYPRMHKGGDTEGLLLYKNPKIILIPRGTYKKILLDPVQVWGEASADPAKQKEMQQVAEMLHSLVYRSLEKDYEMVTSPGPNTLRIQAALTRADKADVVLRAASTIPAPMNVLALTSAWTRTRSTPGTTCTKPWSSGPNRYGTGCASSGAGTTASCQKTDTASASGLHTIIADVESV